jgi:WD40 repeat protein
VAWSPDGKHIASGSQDSVVQIWNASDGSNASTYRGHTDAVDSVAWSPDGKRLASSSGDKTVQIWNAVDGGMSQPTEGMVMW